MAAAEAAAVEAVDDWENVGRWRRCRVVAPPRPAGVVPCVVVVVVTVGAAACIGSSGRHNPSDCSDCYTDLASAEIKFHCKYKPISGLKLWYACTHFKTLHNDNSLT